MAIDLLGTKFESIGCRITSDFKSSNQLNLSTPPPNTTVAPHPPLEGNLHQFQKSIERELQAKNMKVAEVPKLQEGEKIHINLGTSKRKSTKSKVEQKSNGGLFLLKKPPKFAGGSEVESTLTQATKSSGKDDDFGDDWNDFQEATPNGSRS